MQATFAVEMLLDKVWRYHGALDITVPFAKVKFNFVLELVAALGTYLQKCQATEGTYRIGRNETALVEWNGASMKVLTDVRTLTGEKKDVVAGIMEGAEMVREANRERN